MCGFIIVRLYCSMVFLTRTMRRSFSLLQHFTNPHTYTTKLSGTNIICRYRHIISRRPSAIVEDEYDQYDKKDTLDELFSLPPRRPKKKTTNNLKKDLETQEQKKKYNIIKPNEKDLSQLIIKARCRRKRENTVVLESVNLIKDAMKAGLKPKALVFSKQTSAILNGFELSEETLLYQVPYKEIELWSTVGTTPGIIGIFDVSGLSKLEPAVDALPVTVVCDNVRDPRNLGMIIRTTAAAGCKQLILMKGCTDAWNSTVLRASAGAIFHIPIEKYPTWKDLPCLVSSDASVYLADTNTYSTFNEVVEETQASAESQSRDCENQDEKVQNEEADETILAAQAGTINNNKGKESTNDAAFTHSAQRKRAFKKFMSRLPVHVCYYVDYTQNELVLIVGGETTGFSLELQDFLQDRKGVRLHVPLSGDVDSLSSSMSLGILVYEIRRQHLMKN